MNYIKKIGVVLSLMALVLFSGCSSLDKNKVFKIDDTGSEVKNYETCLKEAKEYCSMHWDCKSATYDDPNMICSDGECLCI